MTDPIQTIEQAFESGHFTLVVDLYSVLNPAQQQTNRFFHLGALTGLGKVMEAEALYSAHIGELSPLEQVKARFFLSVMYLRFLDYSKGKALVLENLKAIRKNPDKSGASYAFMGIAMLRYTYGRVSLAQWHARKAYRSGFLSKDKLVQFLAQELLAHCSMGLGFISEGFSFFKDAEKAALVLGRGAYAQAAAASQNLYASTFGRLPSTFDALKSAKTALKFDDTYMKGQYELELARNEILCGQVSAALERLKSCQKDVFALPNKRMKILHQIRYITCLGEQGNRQQVAQLSDWYLKELGFPHDLTDYRLILALLGLKFKVQPTQEVASHLTRLTRKSGLALAHRILARDLGLGRPSPKYLGEDLLGDQIDAICLGTRQSLQAVLLSGQLGLLKFYFQPRPELAHFVFDLVGGSLLFFFAGEVHRFFDITLMQRRFFLSLNEAPKKMEDLCREVWQEVYSPLRHDHVIASFISRLRNQFPFLNTHLQKKEGGWVLPSKKVVFSQSTGAIENLQDQEILTKLRPRHQQILGIIKHKGPDERLVLGRLEPRLGVSKRTCQRDLELLVSMGLILKMGRGRQVSYEIASK